MRTLAACALAVLAAATLGGWVAVAEAEYRDGARAFAVALAPYAIAALGVKEGD